MRDPEVFPAETEDKQAEVAFVRECAAISLSSWTEPTDGSLWPARGDTMMIYEIATLTIDPARAADFEAAVAHAQPHFEAARGFVSFGLQRSIEHPERYRLQVGWANVEAHMVDFRESAGFQAWRALAGPYFVATPEVEHVATVI